MIVTSMQLKSSSRRDIAVLQKESPSFRRRGCQDLENPNAMRRMAKMQAPPLNT